MCRLSVILGEITVISAYDFRSREILSTKEGLFAKRSENVIILEEKHLYSFSLSFLVTYTQFRKEKKKEGENTGNKNGTQCKLSHYFGICFFRIL